MERGWVKKSIIMVENATKNPKDLSEDDRHLIIPIPLAKRYV
jgi:hypothetical protein